MVLEKMRESLGYRTNCPENGLHYSLDFFDFFIHTTNSSLKNNRNEHKYPTPRRMKAGSSCLNLIGTLNC